MTARTCAYCGTDLDGRRPNVRYCTTTHRHAHRHALARAERDAALEAERQAEAAARAEAEAAQGQSARFVRAAMGAARKPRLWPTERKARPNAPTPGNVLVDVETAHAPYARIDAAQAARTGLIRDPKSAQPQEET